jgi:hypothetical protein
MRGVWCGIDGLSVVEESRRSWFWLCDGVLNYALKGVELVIML